MESYQTKQITDPSRKGTVSADSDEDLTEEQKRLIQEHADYVRLHKKPLQFGIESLNSYDGHGGDVQNFIQNENNNHNVTWTQKEVHFWDNNTGKRIGARKVFEVAKAHTQITTISFSHRFRLYLVITADFKMHFMNELLKVVDSLDMPDIRLVNFAYFNDKDAKLVTAGIDGVFIFDFNYKSKYAPLLASQIDQEGRHIKVGLENQTPLEKMCIWVKGLTVDTKNDIIVSWNQGKMCFNHLAGSKAGRLIFSLKDLTSPDNSITDVLINLDYRYFHTGTSTGQILVWKYDTSKKQIHIFQGHFKAVSCLIPVKTEPDLLLSAALDSTVRIWSLDKFQQLYMLHIPTDGLSYIRLYQGGQRVLMAEGQTVTTNAVHLILKNYLAVDAEIEEVQGGFDNIADYWEHQVGFTISKCSDNSAFIQRVGEQHKCTLYPPPSSQNIEAVMHSISLNRVIVLLANCSLCVYKSHRETALLEKILQQSELRDAEDKPVITQQITSIELIRAESKDEIPPFDREILNERLHLASVGEVWGDGGFQEFLALGMSKGSICLLHVKKMQQLYCRFTIHREAVEYVRYLSRTQTFVSVCKEQNFCIWQINKEEKSIRVISELKLCRDLRFFKVMDGGIRHYPETYSIYGQQTNSKQPEKQLDGLEDIPEDQVNQENTYQEKIQIDRFWLGFVSGDQEAFEYNGKLENLFLIEAEKQKEHEAPLTGYDYNRNLGLFVTSCSAGTVRIWSQDKSFLREISFPHSVDSVCFFNSSGDILVSHEKRVSLITYTRYKTKSFDYVHKHQGKINLHLCSDELFEELKDKDDQVRGKKLAVSRPREEDSESPRFTIYSKSPVKGMPQELPLAHRTSVKSSKQQEQQTLEKSRVRDFVKETQEIIEIAEQKAIEQMEEIKRQRQLDEEQERLNPDDREDAKPYHVPAIPLPTRRAKPTKPMLGVSYLSTTGIHDEMMAKKKQFQLGHMTRRNITEHRISSNVMAQNSPVVVPNYDSLNLGPQMPRHRRFQSQFAQHGAAIAGGQNIDILMAGRNHQALKSIGANSGKSGNPRVLKEYNLSKIAAQGIIPNYKSINLSGQSLQDDSVNFNLQEQSYRSQIRQGVGIYPNTLDTYNSLQKPGISNSMSNELNKMSTMHNSSLQHPSAHLDPGASITSTVMTGVLPGKRGSPKPLTILPRKGSRNVYMQKKGLVLDNKELALPMGGIGPMGRSPFILNTERGPKDQEMNPKGIGLTSSAMKIESGPIKKSGAQMSSNQLKGGRNTQNPFTTGPGQRPDSMISGGRGGSPDNDMMYQNKYNTAEKQ